MSSTIYDLNMTNENTNYWKNYIPKKKKKKVRFNLKDLHNKRLEQEKFRRVIQEEEKYPISDEEEESEEEEENEEEKEIKRICNTYGVKYFNANSKQEEGSKKYFRQIAIREKIWEELEEYKRIEYIKSGRILEDKMLRHQQSLLEKKYGLR